MSAIFDLVLKGINKVIDWFASFFEQAFPRSSLSPFATPEETKDFFDSVPAKPRKIQKTQKTLDFFPEEDISHAEICVDSSDHGEIPSHLLKDVPVEDLDEPMRGTLISKDSLLKAPKNWAQLLSEQISEVEGVHIIVDPYNSRYYSPYGSDSKVRYPFTSKASDSYTVRDLLQNRISALVKDVPIAIVRPVTGTLLIVQFENKELYLLREYDRIRIHKQNSNTTKVLGMRLKDYRKKI